MRTKIIYILTILAFVISSCNKGESYADLLKKEEKAVNWYLSGESIETEIPADSIFVTGENAPFYKMNKEGTIYMKVLDAGDRNDRPKEGERVYFRYSRMNLRNLYEADVEQWYGNSSDLGESTASTSFLFGNYTLTSSYQYGKGIQYPLNFLGYNSRVRLVLKAEAGFYSEQSQCLPFVYDIRYFKGIY